MKKGPFKMKGWSPFKNDKSKKEVRQYKKMLNKLNVSESDTLVSGSSVDHATSIKKANINLSAANPKARKKDQITKYNKKTGKYTTYVVGPK